MYCVYTCIFGTYDKITVDGLLSNVTYRSMHCIIFDTTFDKKINEINLVHAVSEMPVNTNNLDYYSFSGEMREIHKYE